jgi:hypothetical protein
VRAHRERAIADLAGRQRGVIIRTPLRDAGLTDHAIDHRLRSARLHRLRRLLPYPAGDVDVTVPGRRCDSKRGIRIHRVSELDPRAVRKLNGIPITTPARTLLDLAAIVPSRELEQALAEAEARRLVRRSDLTSLPAGVGPRPGVPALRCLLEGDAPALTRSEAGEHFLALVRKAELPAPMRTSASDLTRSTSCGGSTGSSSRSTASASTRHAPRLSATVSGTPTSCRAASA